MTQLSKISTALSDYYLTFINPIFFNKKVECPCCGWKGPAFCSHGVEVRKNARCPRCNSLERHRLYHLFLKEHIKEAGLLKVLHFAPEKIITKLFKQYNHIDYLSADLDPKKGMVVEDITQLSFPDNSFDIIFCSHVLEHIADDHKAMKEVYRVLKPNGFALLQVPIKDVFNGKVIQATYEDSTITSPADRERVFGQHDHVRIYGRDYKDRLIKAGFAVQVIDLPKQLGDALVKQYALLPQLESANETDGWIYYCTK
jgi:predicted SAM-dependent methyltransferase